MYQSYLHAKLWSGLGHGIEARAQFTHRYIHQEKQKQRREDVWKGALVGFGIMEERIFQTLQNVPARSATYDDILRQVFAEVTRELKEKGAQHQKEENNGRKAYLDKTGSTPYPPFQMKSKASKVSCLKYLGSKYAVDKDGKRMTNKRYGNHWIDFGQLEMPQEYCLWIFSTQFSDENGGGGGGVGALGVKKKKRRKCTIVDSAHFAELCGRMFGIGKRARRRMGLKFGLRKIVKYF